MSEWLGLLLTFSGFAWLSFLVLGRLARSRQQMQDRLAPGEGDSASEGPPEMVLGPMTQALAAQLPLTEKRKAALRQELRRAGFYRPTALTEYAAIRTLLVLGTLLATGVLALVADAEEAQNVVLGGVGLALLGYSLPRVYLYFRGKSRGRQIERGLPVAVDLLTLCLSGGQNILSALERVSIDLRFSFPVLADELRIVHQQAELHSLDQALHQWADRARVGEVRNLALLLAQSEHLGTDTAAALTEFASNFRVNLRQRAEAQANRTSFWMLFPTVFCLLIAAAIILIGPAYLEFWHQQQLAARALRTAQQDIKRSDISKSRSRQPAPAAEGTAPLVP
jgi:pilus assembly protein TadC